MTKYKPIDSYKNYLEFSTGFNVETGFIGCGGDSYPYMKHREKESIKMLDSCLESMFGARNGNKKRSLVYLVFTTS